MKNYKYILFDWDGCVADTLSIWLNAYRETFNEHAIFPSNKEIVDTSFGKYRGPMDLGIPADKIDDYMSEVFLKMKSTVGEAKIHVDVRETLDILKRNKMRLCVVTSSERHLFEKALVSNGMQDYFEFSITAKDVSKHKPDPEIVHLAMEKFSGTLEETLIVGDSDKDVLAGNNAGIDSVIVYPEINHRFYTERYLKSLKPTYFVDNFSKLKQIVLE